MNFPVLGAPIDFAITADERFAIVKTARQISQTVPAMGHVYVWDMSNPLAPQLVVDGAAQPGTLEGSDAAFVVEDRLLTSASHLLNGIGLLPTPALVHKLEPAGFDVSPTPLNLGASPFVSASVWDADLAIAGAALGMLGVLRAVRNNDVLLLDLKSGAPYGYPNGLKLPDFDFPTPLPGGTYNDGETALGLRDAVVITQQRVVSIANTRNPHDFTFAQFQPPATAAWSCGVGIAPVDATATLAPLTDYPMGTGSLGNPTFLSRNFLHDLAVSPNEKYAAVSGNDFYAVYDLGTMQRIAVASGPAFPTPNFEYLLSNRSMVTLDSVEMSNTHAVFAGNNHNWLSGPPTVPSSAASDGALCEIAIVQIRGSQVTHRTWNVASITGWPAGTLRRAVDLAMSPRGRWAFVHTRGGLVYFDLASSVSLANLQTPAPLPAPDPFWFSPNAADFVVSDSIAVTDTEVIAIGTRQINGVTTAFADVYSLPTSGAPVLVAALVLGAGQLPIDVALSAAGTHCVVRTRRAPTPQAPVPQPQDFDSGGIHLVDLSNASVTSFLPQSSQGGYGWSAGLDHVECASNFAISGGAVDAVASSATAGQVQIVVW